jgi:3-deoxy-D-arabino-heptulosonate 7-phosphate (DAHP) synthase class II
MAGQYAKPRSKPTEMHEGKEIPSYRYVLEKRDEKRSMVIDE